MQPQTGYSSTPPSGEAGGNFNLNRIPSRTTDPTSLRPRSRRGGHLPSKLGLFKLGLFKLSPYRLGLTCLLLLAPSLALEAQPETPRDLRHPPLDTSLLSANKSPLTSHLTHGKACLVHRISKLDAGGAWLTSAVIVLDKELETDDAASLETLLAAVRRGATLLVGSEAALSLPKSEAYSRLIGRGAIGEQTARAPLAIEISDQSHPITQSVTHFRHEGRIPKMKPTPDSTVIARSIDARSESGGQFIPVMWERREGRGYVLVSALSHRSGPSKNLVAALLARGAEQGAALLAGGRGREVTIPLSGKFVLAADKLGPGDEGILPGREPRPGFFRGREVAATMSYLGAPWLTRRDRDASEQPDKVLESLGLKEGQHLADLGSGNGYFTLRMARLVGKTGKVYAVDIQQEMLDLLARRAKAAGIETIELVKSKQTDPGLPPRSIDLLLMVDVYHELSKPTEVMKHVHEALKEDGRVVLVEYRGEDPTVRIKPLHRMTARQAEAEMRAQGFRLLELKSFLPYQHILIFGKDGKKVGE